MGEDERAVDGPDDDAWPYDPAWVELGAPPLERLRREALEPAQAEPRSGPAPLASTRAIAS